MYDLPNTMQNKILGLIAGNGNFPLMFAREAKAQGYTVVAAGIKGDTSFLLKFLSPQCRYFYVGDLQKLFEYFRSHQVTQVLMAGQVSQRNLFDPSIKLDSRSQKLFDALQDHKADTIFSAVGDLLKQEGMELMDSIPGMIAITFGMIAITANVDRAAANQIYHQETHEPPLRVQHFVPSRAGHRVFLLPISNVESRSLRDR